MNVPAFKLYLPKPLLPLDHVNLTACKEVTAIAKPLMDTFKVKSFGFLKCYWTGSMVSLGSNGPWSEYWNNNNLYRYHEGIPNFHGQEVIFLHEAPKDSPFGLNVIKPFEEIFDLCHSVSLIERHLGYLIIYTYTTTKSNTTFKTDFLVHLKEFKAFNYYFKNEAAHLIAKAEQQKYRLPKYPSSSSSIFSAKDKVSKNDIDEFKKKIEVKRHYLNGINYLTAREFECVKLIMDGKFAKDIGRILNISVHTVNQYFTCIKQKMKVNHKKEIITQLQQLDEHASIFSGQHDKEVDPYQNEYINFLMNITDD